MSDDDPSRCSAAAECRPGEAALRLLSPSWPALRSLLSLIGMPLPAHRQDRRDFVPCEVTARTVPDDGGAVVVVVDVVPTPHRKDEDDEQDQDQDQDQDQVQHQEGPRCWRAPSWSGAALRALVVLLCVCEPAAQTAWRVRDAPGALDREHLVGMLCFQLVAPCEYVILWLLSRQETFVHMHCSIMSHYCAAAVSSRPVTLALFGAVSLLVGGTVAYLRWRAADEWGEGALALAAVAARAAQWAVVFLVLALSAVVYGVVFCAHAVRLRRCRRALMEAAPDPARRPPLCEVSHQITSLRNEVDTAVRDLGNLIAAPTILAAVGTGIVVDVARQRATGMDPFSAAAIAAFCAVQAFFMLSTSKLGMARQDLFGITFDPDFSAAYVATASSSCGLAELDGETALRDMDHLLSRVADANALAQWGVLQRVLGEPWLDLTVFGVSLLDGSFIKQGLAMSALFLACVRWGT